MTGSRTDGPRVLIADDQRDVLEALRMLLKPEGFVVETARSPRSVFESVEKEDFDAALIDLNYTRDTTSGREGIELLEELRLLDPTLPVIVMTAWGSVDGAVEAMKNGARDYIEKPWDNNRVIATLRTQVELGAALRRGARLEEENRHLRDDGRPVPVADSRAMREVMDLIDRVGPSDANVLITGEHGTGKEVIARRLHEVSARSERPLVTINAGALPEGLVESELFGHVRGAFTDARSDRAGCFEVADKGTLFLDEIANVPLAQQAKLLRVIESGEIQRVGSSKVRRVDVRLISATNADLSEAIAGESFREDLLYRLNTVEIHIPPLRQRREDIPPLAAHFLAVSANHYAKQIDGFTPEAMQLLLEHRWTGNVRELEHAVERAVLMAMGNRIQKEDLGLRDRPDTQGVGMDRMTLDEAERMLIEQALERNQGNVSRSAVELGLSRSALYRRLSRYGL